MLEHVLEESARIFGGGAISCLDSPLQTLPVFLIFNFLLYIYEFYELVGRRRYEEYGERPNRLTYGSTVEYGGNESIAIGKEL